MPHRLPALLAFLAFLFASTAALFAQPALDDQPVESAPAPARPAHPIPRAPGEKPTLWIIGDSTVRVGTPGQQGWGDALAPFFDPAKLTLANHAIGGRSSRTFLTDGRWDALLPQLRAGDVVIMQFGHNDASPINEDPPVTKSTRARGVIRDNSDATVEIVNILTGRPETVRSYGWYLRHFAATARERGALPIVCSPIPRKSWNPELTRVNRADTSWALWARQAADQTGALFIDLNEIVARGYERLGAPAVDPLFADRGTHTSPAGAAFNALALVSGLNGLGPKNPLAATLSPEGRAVPPFAP